MDQKKILAEKFEADRSRLRSVAYRMLGSLGEAEDAVQETWLRASRADASAVENLGGWLTTIIGRVCLDLLRSRRTRREQPLDAHVPEPVVSREEGSGIDPEHEAQLADSVGLALLVVLDRLGPAERIAFVLHDMFDVPFDDIAPIVDRTPAATRQLASRARRRVQGADARPDPDRTQRRKLVDAFLAAARGGDFSALLAVLDPDVVFRADAYAVRLGGSPEIRGAAAAADFFKGRAALARSILVEGRVGVVVAPLGRLALVLDVTIRDGRIVEIHAVADPEHLGRLDLSIIAD